MNTDNTTSSTTKASVLRQLAALFYDCLLLSGIILVAFIPITYLTSQGIVARDNPIFQIYLVGVCFLYFGWFWTRNGKTLGMRIWHIKIQGLDNNLISWPQALARFLTGLPAWLIIMLAMFIRYVPQEILQASLPEVLLTIPSNTLLIIAAIMLVIDHWSGAWRDKLTKCRIVRTE